jgi:hypothetical protein
MKSHYNRTYRTKIIAQEIDPSGKRMTLFSGEPSIKFEYSNNALRRDEKWNLSS